jgi:nitrate/nitrite-specific signal transduction histidine kinase
MGTYILFKEIGTTGVPGEKLTAAVDNWCKAIDKVAEKKHRWLLAANILFLVSSALTVLLVLLSMSPKG